MLDNFLRKGVLFFIAIISGFILNAQEEAVIRGIVYDKKTNRPLADVSVMLVNANNLALKGNKTNTEGKFEIRSAPGAARVAFSSLGYQTQEFALSDKSFFTVYMAADSGAMDEVQVVAAIKKKADLGFLSIDRRELSSAIASVDLANTDKMPVTSVDQLLQGMAPGIQVVAASGDPGAAASIRIRGISSISGMNDPLWIVDGAEIIGNDYKVASITDFGFSPIGDLDPSDIASIDILKDASATALYGSRGANGVIVIQTKRGKKGKPKFQFNTKYTLTEVPRTIPMLSGDEQRIYYLEKTTGGVDKGTTLPELRGDLTRTDAWIFNNNTDWVDAITRKGFYQQYNTALSGGGDRLSYYWGLGYANQYGTTKGTGYDRFNTRFNLNYNVSDRLKITADLNYTNSLTDKRGQDHPITSTDINPMLFARQTPAYFPIYSRNGLNYFVDRTIGVSSHSRYNPLAIIDYSTYNTRANRFMASTSVDFKILKNLDFRSQVSADFRESADEYFLPGYATDAIPNEVLYNAGMQTEGYQLMINNNNRLTWSAIRSGDHRLTFTGVLTYNLDRDNSTSLEYYNGASPELKSADAAAIISSATGTYGTRKYLGMFVQGHYALKDRYFLTLTGKSEGDSRYGADNPYSVFPAVGAAWDISRESFLKDAEWISFIKPRFAFGVTGNLPNIDNLYDIAYGTGTGYLGETYTYPSKFASDNIREERTSEYNLGLDWSFFRDRLTGQLDFYSRTTNNLLLQERLSSTLGYASEYINFGTVRNSGWELGITGVILKGGENKLRWKSFFNIATNKNKLLKLPELFDENAFSVSQWGFTSKLQEGDVIGGFYGYRALGVYSRDADAILRDDAGNIIYEADGTTPKYMRFGSVTGLQLKGGDMIYDDVNGDGVINELDRVQIGDANPLFFGGWNNTFNYKNWIFTVNLQYQTGNDVINATRLSMERMLYSHNQSRSILSRWRRQGDITDMPRAQPDNEHNSAASTRWVEDGSYVRLKTVSLTYNAGKRFVQRLGLGIQQVGFFVTGYNLYTWTHYKGLDPEVPITGSVALFGIDNSATAPARQFTAGLNLSF
ncbi:SusC/RagA family TonB-linked outer membrane protein [Niabella aurantiaca]|uniref:SusC/RagA family TonB-linked outer membrane protein n=1 Tax=Niabella aurantiaca TaxID=379900 RepID=UPI00036C665C|nr:TonB-dependent receptor [Niabella aurantiaca]